MLARTCHDLKLHHADHVSDFAKIKTEKAYFLSSAIYLKKKKIKLMMMTFKRLFEVEVGVAKYGLAWGGDSPSTSPVNGFSARHL